jgi:C4-dicarboxylate-specific signal transduction histidine kinase
MRRREFITLLGGATTFSFAASAQHMPVRSIGFLHAGSPEPNANFVSEFRKGLSETDHLEGRDFSIEFRWAAGRDVEINDAILEVVALTRTEVANNSVSVRTQLAEGLLRVQGDRVQLQQVLLNLIINAIEAMRDVGEKERELLIITRHGPDGVSVEVRDSGPGFAPADIDRVFEAFHTTKPSGLGLGLSICRSIIEAHNGRLWASANQPRGASFQFALLAITNTAS